MKYLLCLFLAGCNWPSQISFFFPAAPDDAFAAATQAASEWNAACPGVQLDVTRSVGDVPIHIVPGEMIAPALAVTHRHSIQREPDFMLVSEGAQTWRSVYAHEMGHALGLDHHDQGIMLPQTHPDLHVTPADCP